MTGAAQQKSDDSPTRCAAALESSLLPRMQLFEFNELSWFPETLRNAITEVLRVLSDSLSIDEVIRPVLEHVIRQSGADKIIDLCSGAGGPVISLATKLTNSELVIYLTDKFPNRDAIKFAEQAGRGRIAGYPAPVDATRVPDQLRGLRTLFNGFHHFPPQIARAILTDAYLKRQAIAIFEITDRSVFRTASNFILSFVTMLALLPRMRPRRPLVWALTYVLPVLPVAFGWDGFVSCMRSYTRREMEKLLEGLNSNWNYIWSIGRLKVPHAPVHVTYLTGVPRLP